MRVQWFMCCKPTKRYDACTPPELEARRNTLPILKPTYTRDDGEYLF